MISLRRTISFSAKILEPATRWTHNVGVIILAAMMFLTATDVIGRYVFNRPILGSLELQEYMMAIVVAMTIGYCGFLKGHINVDILFNYLPQRARASLNFFHFIIGTCLFALVCWRTVLQGLEEYHSGLTSVILQIPVFPFYFVAALGSAILSITWLHNAIEFLSQGVGKWNQ